MRIAIIAAIAVVVVGVAVMINFRRELPYNFDIVRTDKGIAVINVESWVSRDLDLSLEQNGKILARGVIDSETHTGLLENVGAPGQSRIVIGRSDLVGRLRYKPKQLDVDLNGKQQVYIVLVGASIGYQWNLPDYGERSGDDRIAFGHRIEYRFDKGDAIAPILEYAHKPKAVIIKECSEYFPRSIEESAAQLQQWVELLRKNNILPIIATTTPVRKEPQSKSKQGTIDGWNRTVREMGRKEGIHVLDLASALQTSFFDTHLKPGYYVDDGYHMTPLAYREAFDPALKKLLDEIL